MWHTEGLAAEMVQATQSLTYNICRCSWPLQEDLAGTPALLACYRVFGSWCSCPGKEVSASDAVWVCARHNPQASGNARQLFYFDAADVRLLECISEVGVFACLTNSYRFTAMGGPENFHGVFEADLSQRINVIGAFVGNTRIVGRLSNHIPVIHASVGNTRIVSRVAVGNRHGLLVPSITTDQELAHLRRHLPEEVKVQHVGVKLSALGHSTVCNAAYVDFVHRLGPRNGRVHCRCPEG